MHLSSHRLARLCVFHKEGCMRQHAPVASGVHVFAGGLLFLSQCNTKLAEALHHFRLAPLSPRPPAATSAAGAAPTRDGRVCAGGVAAMVAAVMADVCRAQRNAQCAGSACSHGTASCKPLLPVDNIIMDEAACSTDYIMPCLLATLPVNLVRFHAEFCSIGPGQSSSLMQASAHTCVNLWH